MNAHDTTMPAPPEAWQRQVLQVGAQRWTLRRSSITGARPWLLLIHGTGSSCDSWRGLAPLLASEFNLLAPDLPGHAGSCAAAHADASLPGMALALRGLLRSVQVAPEMIVGHSAGVAIALRLVLDGMVGVRAVVGINAALLPPSGLRGRMFSPLARLLAGQAWVPRLFARRAANPAVASRLLQATGSTLDEAGMALYESLLRDPAHAAGALAMMAAWDLEPLALELPRLKLALQLIVGSNDRTLPPSESHGIAARAQNVQLESLPGLGHLAHEERPDLVAAIVHRAARGVGLARRA